MSKILNRLCFCFLIISLFIIGNARSQNSYGWERIFNSIYGINGYYKTEKNPSNNKLWIVRTIGDLFGTGNYDFIRYSETSNGFHPASNSMFRAFHFYGVVGGNHYSGWSFPINLALSNIDSNFVIVNNNDADLYYGTPNIRLLYSFNNGVTRTEILPFHEIRFFGLVIDPKNDSTNYASQYTTSFSVIHKSINRGITWTANDTIFSFSGNLSVNPILTNYVYGFNDSLYISSDAGINFELISNKSFSQLYYNYSDSSIIGIEKNRLYKSFNYGYGWNFVDSLSDAINVLEIDIDNENIVYAGTIRGLFKSTNGGANFYLFNNSFSPSRKVIGLTKNSGRDYVYVVTEEAVYKCWNSYLVDIENSSTILPDLYCLNQNYPNPFNPKTSISYTISSAVNAPFVQIKIFNILGNELITLVNEKQNSGTYKVDFDASDYSSGAYLYSLSINNIIVDTKRMVLIK